MSRPESGAQSLRAGNVGSPCTSVCTIAPATGLCAGCWRSLDEIAAWSGLSDLDKRRIWKLLPQRRDAQRAGPVAGEAAP
jgi:predicted Fe-S protein YdhL (DUF1289 family)